MKNTFASISVVELPKYRCPKHGYVGEVIGISFELTELKGPFKIHRKYCCYCLVEMLDKHCHEVTRE